MLVVATTRLRYRDLALMDALEKQVVLVAWLAALPIRLQLASVFCLSVVLCTAQAVAELSTLLGTFAILVEREYI